MARLIGSFQPPVRCCSQAYTATSMSFGSTPAIKSKSRSRCRSGMLAKMACVAIRQSFAEPHPLSLFHGFGKQRTFGQIVTA